MRNLRQIIPTQTALSATIICSGGSRELSTRIIGLTTQTFLRSGLRGFATMIKSWSKVVRSILARDYLDTSHIGHCKIAKNCVFGLRKAGMSHQEISLVISHQGSTRGIPPFLLDAAYCRALLPNPSFEDLSKIVPFANIGRCAPPADQDECDRSKAKFFETTSKDWPHKFDCSVISTLYARLCSSEESKFSKWEASKKSSFDSTRGQDGKLGEVTEQIVESFLLQSVGELIPERPAGDIIDIFGNTVIPYGDWNESAPIGEVFYPSLKSEDLIDRRFGLFGVLWAIHDIYHRFPGDLTSSSRWISMGLTRPTIRFEGVIPSRVSAQPEEGWKARIITITPLSVAILQIVLRHVMDGYIRSDPLVKVGLLSKVKLYDLMFAMNHSRDGLVDGKPSFFHHSCESADLTTATDSPYREAVASTLRPFVRNVLRGDMYEFQTLVLDLALSPREFPGESPPTWVHRCGVMMGEAMSGVYLNVMSGIVRCYIESFQECFHFYGGNSVNDADEFIAHHWEWIQDWLDDPGYLSFDKSSSQSGDDLVRFNFHPVGEQKRFLVLLYRVFGLIPSSSTFYSSDQMGTFTEEFCLKTPDSAGWTFVDLLKPRLFICNSSKDGVDSVLSRISQITGVLKYRRDDIDLVSNVCDSVDLMIQSNPIIRDRVRQYSLVLEFPSFLGGLDHPAQFLLDWELNIREDDKDCIYKLLHCTPEEFMEVKYHWVFEDLPEVGAQAAREMLRSVLYLFESLEVGEPDLLVPYQKYEESSILDRSLFPSYSTYSRELHRLKSSVGLANLDEIICTIFSGLKLRDELYGIRTEDKNPLILLRNRREFLISRSRLLPYSGSFEPGMVGALRHRFRTSYQGKVTQRSAFLELSGFDNLPTLTVPI